MNDWSDLVEEAARLRRARGEDAPNAWLAAVAQSANLRNGDLLTMSASKDPFNKGTRGDYIKAVWFARMYNKHGFYGIHLRDLHYRIVSAPVEERVLVDAFGNFSEYMNIEKHLNALGEAGGSARVLGTVEWEAISDAKAPPLILGMNVSERPEADSEVDSGTGFWVEPPDYDPDLSGAPTSISAPRLPRSRVEFDAPEFGVYGYEYHALLQPNLIEIWSEKSGDDAVLRKLALRYGVNYVPGVGFASLTTIRKMLRRLEAVGKPGRILYVSDFDPAGAAMPRAVSRYGQFSCWELEELAGEIAPHIMADNVALTQEQAEMYNLPRSPIKEDDTRRAQFELLNGEGAVEVNALEFFHPGVLERLVAERIEELQDPDLRRKAAAVRWEARERVRRAVDEATEEHRERLETIAGEANAVLGRYGRLYEQLGQEVAARYGDRYRRLGERYERHVEDIQARLEAASEDAREEIENLEVDLPEPPEGEVAGERGNGWLFDSRRGFLQQTRIFRRLQGKE